MATIRNFLNKLRWDRQLSEDERNNYRLTYIHRGAPDDEITINCNQISEVLATCFEVYSEDLGRDAKIPFHRIKIIQNIRSGKIVYEKAELDSEEEEY